MHSEKAKHTETKEKLKTLEEKFEDLENRLKVSQENNSKLVALLNALI